MDIKSFSDYLSTLDVEIHSAYKYGDYGDDDCFSLWATVNLKYGPELIVPIIFSSKDAEILEYLAGEKSEDSSKDAEIQKYPAYEGSDDVFKGSTSFAFIEVVANNGLKIDYAVITDMEKEGSNRGNLHGGLVIDGQFYGMAITDAVIVAVGTGKDIRIGKNTLDDIAELSKETKKKYALTKAPDDMYV